MTKIAQGIEGKEEVVQRHVGTVAEVFRLLRLHIALLDEQLLRILPAMKTPVSDARLLQSDFCVCEKCGGSMNLMGSGGTRSSGSRRRGADSTGTPTAADQSTNRFLACSNLSACSLILRMPARGRLSRTSYACPYCRFKVISVENVQTGKSHSVCPYCFSNPPTQEAANAPNGELRCFSCCHPSCHLARGHNSCGPKQDPQQRRFREPTYGERSCGAST